jgi:hypothetical protein
MSNSIASPTRDNLVSDCPGSPNMSSNAEVGTGKESACTIEDLAKRFAIMLELVHPLQPLVETVKNLAAQVAEQGHQQHALNLAMPPVAPAQQDTPGEASTGRSITGIPIPDRPSHEDEDDISNFLPTYCRKEQLCIYNYVIKGLLG